jgi:NCS1 family nucleobase:cation symporter-1
MDFVKQKKARVQESLRGKNTIEGWVLPKQETSFAPAGTWTNIDLDVTPPERRVWTAMSVLGYWVSDIVSLIEQSYDCCVIDMK